MMQTAPECPYRETDLPSRYVAKTLADDEAERFEEHYFGCEDCWAAVKGGNEIRHALVARPAVRWLPLAAAAAMLLAAVALVPWIGRDDGSDAMRSGAATITVRTTSSNGQLRIEWSRVSGAAHYEVTLHQSDGAVIHRKVTAATSISMKIDAAVRTAAIVTVTAVSADGEEIARSKPHRIATIPTDARLVRCARDRTPRGESARRAQRDRLAPAEGGSPRVA